MEKLIDKIKLLVTATLIVVVILFLLIVLLICFWPEGSFPGPSQCDFICPVAKGYIIGRTSAHEVKVVSIGPLRNSDDPEIPTEVIEVGWDARFVIAKQLYPKQEILNYWVLDVNIPKVYGPFDETGFEKQKTILSVPASIIFEDINIIHLRQKPVKNESTNKRR